MDLDNLRSDLQAALQDDSLNRPENLAARMEALDLVYFVEEIARVHRRSEIAPLRRQGRSLRDRLTRVNNLLFQELRTHIRSGQYTANALRREFDRYTEYRPEPRGLTHIGFDGLDALVRGIFDLDRCPEPSLELSREMIHLEFTPCRAILDMIDHAGLTQDDVFYDLGSGLGQVVLLVRLFGGIRAVGVEREPAYCTFAHRCARNLNLSRVTYLNADARQVDYAEGTVFFLYTPFGGSIYDEVMAKLRKGAQGRPIRVCTFGPCTPDVATEPWLRDVDGCGDHQFKLAVFESR